MIRGLQLVVTAVLALSAEAWVTSAKVRRSRVLRSSLNEEFAKKLSPELRAEYEELHGSAGKTWDADWYPTKDPPAKGSILVTFELVEDFMRDTFTAVGVPEEEAKLAADVLIEADKRGISSHGVGRLKPIYCDRLDQGILYPTAPLTIVKETASSALVDGNLGLGLTIGPACMEMAIRKAKETGVGVVLAQNSTHYGIAGYYATMATEAGCVGFSTTNARPSIAPTFGVEGMLGTNPLCFGIPSDDPFPFVIDAATSVNQRGKIERYAREGRPTPKGQVIDSQGRERTDTDGILRDLVTGDAALAPLGGAGEEMGGYKGFGWAAAVELACTAFQGGPFGESLCGVDRATGKPSPMPLGHVFVAIDIAPLRDLDDFKATAGALLRGLRESRKDPSGPGRIWTAGEPEDCARKEKEAAGGFMIPPALQRDMAALRDTKLSPADRAKYTPFPWEQREGCGYA